MLEREVERGLWVIFFYRDLHFLDAGVNVQDSIVAWADDGLVFNDDNLITKRNEKIV